MAKKIFSTTQEHLDIADIKDDVVILKNGSAVAVLETTAINFDLLSIREQDAAIAAFSSLLNSLSFPIQITMRSKKMDISEYLETVKETESKQTNPKIRAQIEAYRTFIQDELITKGEVLDKKFYVTVPFKTFVSSSSPLGWMDTLFKGQTKNKGKVNVDKILQEAKSDLDPKTDFMVKEFERIGIKARVLNTAELIKLLYEIYNSETAQRQKIRGDVSEYTAALVEPKIA